MRWAGHVTCMGDIRNPYKIVVRKHEWKRPFWRPKERWRVHLNG
jgi:hypothetical protein